MSWPLKMMNWKRVFKFVTPAKAGVLKHHVFMDFRARGNGENE